MQIKQKIEGEGDNENCTGQRMQRTFVIAIPGGNTAGSEAVPIIVVHSDSSTLSCYVRVQTERREGRGLKGNQFQMSYYHSMDLFKMPAYTSIIQKSNFKSSAFSVASWNVEIMSLHSSFNSHSMDKYEILINISWKASLSLVT